MTFWLSSQIYTAPSTGITSICSFYRKIRMRLQHYFIVIKSVQMCYYESQFGTLKTNRLLHNLSKQCILYEIFSLAFLQLKLYQYTTWFQNSFPFKLMHQDACFFHLPIEPCPFMMQKIFAIDLGIVIVQHQSCIVFVFLIVDDIINFLQIYSSR